MASSVSLLCMAISLHARLLGQ